MKIILLALTVAVFTLSACAPATSKPAMNEPPATKESSTPQAGEPSPASTLVDSNLVRGNVYLDSIELFTTESSPVQFTLVLKGNLPTPCDQLRVEASQPDAENKILLNVYSLSPADKMCAQVLKPFEENFPLGGFPTGHYTLWVNGQKTAEFDA
jgi:hypothetical protein